MNAREPATSRSSVVGLSKPRLLEVLGPGLISGAAERRSHRDRDVLAGGSAVRLRVLLADAARLSDHGERVLELMS